MKIINKQPGAFLQNLTKAYTEGVYADTPANRKLGRVGMSYKQYTEKIKGDSKNEKTWDTIDAFYKEKSDEGKLWHFWYKFKVTGDPANLSSMQKIFEKKFSNIESWKITTPNTGEAIITAIDKEGNKVAKLDLNDSLELHKLQTFMDKCYEDKNENKLNIGTLINKTTTLKSAEGKRLDKIIEYSNSAEGVEGIKVAKDATDEEKKIAIAKFYFDASEGDAGNLDSIIEDALSE